MHVDEYEISLARELGLCNGLIRQCQRSLERMEKRHGMTTEDFLERWQQGRLAASREFKAWQESAEGVRAWSEARDEYARLLGIMKI